MSDFNPAYRPYCYGCPHYQGVGRVLYKLEDNIKARECKHIARCERVYDKAKKEVPNG